MRKNAVAYLRVCGGVLFWGGSMVQTAKRTMINETASVGRGHVPADREAADGRHEQVCTYSLVPTLGGDMSPPYKGFHGNDMVGDLYVVGGSCTGGDMSPPYRSTKLYILPQSVCELTVAIFMLLRG